jgi:Transposase DDE domain group 1
MGGERSLSPLRIERRGSVPSKFPSAASAINAAWLEVTFIAGDLLAWTRTLALGERFRTAEPERIRYTLVHAAGILIRHGRRHVLRVAAGWPWAQTWLTASPASNGCRSGPDRRSGRQSAAARHETPARAHRQSASPIT